MSEPSSLTALIHWKRQIEPAARVRVADALRRDPVIWQILHDEGFSFLAVDRLERVPAAWNPANLALLALNYPVQAVELQTDPDQMLDSKILQAAIKAFETYNPRQKGQTNLEKMQSAGLVALLLRERRRKTGSWQGLVIELVKSRVNTLLDWVTPLACTLGMINDQPDFLAALLDTTGQTAHDAPERAAAVFLQVILRNPLSLEEQTGLLISAARQKLAHPALLLEQAGVQSPDLARQAAMQWINLDQNASTLNTLPGAHFAYEGVLHAIRRLTWQAQLQASMGNTLESLELLQQAGREGALLQSELSALWAGQARRAPDEIFPGDIAQAWQAAASTELPAWCRRSPDDQLSQNPRYNQALQAAQNPEVEDPTDLPAAELLAMAQAALQRSDMVGAMNLAQGALRQSGPVDWYTTSRETVDTLIGLSRLFLQLGMPASTVEAARTCLDGSPTMLEALQCAGEGFQRQQRPDEALEYTLSAALLASTDLAAQRRCAGTLEDLQAWDLALEEWAEIVRSGEARTGSAFPEDLHSLAACALHSEDFSRAVEACLTALTLNDQDWEAHYLYGLALNQQGESAQAEEHLRKAVEIDSQQADCWLALAEIQREHHAADQSGATLLSALLAMPDHPGLHLAYGENLLLSGAHTQALEAFKNAWEHAGSNNNPALTIRTGIRYSESLLKLGHAAEAQAVIEPLYLAASNDPALAKIYALSLTAQGQYAEALPALQTAIGKAISLAEYDDPAILTGYGAALLALGRDADTAAAALQHSLDLQPADLESQVLLAEAYTAAGNYSAALDIFRQAHDNPEVKSPQLQMRLAKGMGKTALALKLAPVALAAFQDVINMDTASVENFRLLAEANWMAGLGNHAWDAARNAIRLDSTPETVTWFADRALEWSAFGNSANQNAENPAAPGLISAARIKKTSTHTLTIGTQEMLGEAALVLRQARTDNPGSAAVMIRLGMVLARLNNLEEAALVLAQTVDAAEATPTDLDKAADELLNLHSFHHHPGSAAQASTCLEKSMLLAADSPAELQALRLLKLAAARQYAGQTEAMLQALEKALQLAPHEPKIYQSLFSAWNSAKNLDHALRVLEQADAMISDSDGLTEMHLQASRLCQADGRLALAIQHAGQARAHAALRTIQVADGVPAAANMQLARLYRLVLLHEKTAAVLEETALPDLTDEQDAFEYCCLRAELALDASQEIEGAYYATQAVELQASHPWAATLQTRLVYRQKDQPLAVQTLKAICANLGAKNDAQTYLGIARAAAEMAEWDLALEMARRAGSGQSGSLLPGIYLSELIVRQAEYTRLCHELDVLKHTPGAAAFSPDIQNEYRRSMDSVETCLLQAVQESAAGTAKAAVDSWTEALGQIARWKCRGAAVFNQVGTSEHVVPAAWAVWKGFQMQADDFAALLGFIRQSKTSVDRLSAPAQAREAAESYSYDGQVLLQAAMTLTSGAPNEALRCAQNAASLLSCLPRHPQNILAHRLLAQLEKQNGYFLPALQSIHVALAAWPNEARWHNLAARIRLALPEVLPPEVGLNGTPDAVAYLEEAISLESGFADHAILLSKLLQNHTNDDPHSLKKSLKILEKASSDNPESPAIWLALANLYRATANKAAAAGKAERKLALSSVISAAACAERAASLALDQNESETGAGAYVLLGQLALAKGDAEEGYRQARAALRMQNTSAAAILLQVDCLEAMGRSEDAIDLINRSLALGPNNLNIEIKRAALMSARAGQQAPEQTVQAKTAVGLEMLEDLAKQYPDEPKVYFALAKSLASAGRKDEAINGAQTALALNQKAKAAEPAEPSQEDAAPLDALSTNEISEMHALLGALFADLGHLDQALHQFDTALQYNPNNAEAYLALAGVYVKQRQLAKAQEVLKEAMSAVPHDPRVFFQAGNLYKQAHNLKEAEAVLHKAASLAPEDVHIKRQLAGVIAARLMQSQQIPAQPVENLDGVR